MVWFFLIPRPQSHSLQTFCTELRERGRGKAIQEGQEYSPAGMDVPGRMRKSEKVFWLRKRVGRAEVVVGGDGRNSHGSCSLPPLWAEILTRSRARL